MVTNLRHEVVALSPMDRHLLPLLYGTRARKALEQALAEKVSHGLFHVSEDDRPVTDPARAADLLAQVLDQRLPWLAKAALLLA
jgi:methyltransferase-like protein